MLPQGTKSIAMKTIKITLILVFCLATLPNARAQEKYSTVKIYAPADKTQRARLIGLLQVDHFQQADNGAIVVEISSREIDRLRTTPYQYDIIVDDVAKNLEIANQRYYRSLASGGQDQQRLAFEETGKAVDNIIITPSAFVVQPTFGGYYSFAQMETAMNNLVAAYPGLASKTSLGLTHEGRNIWCIKISDNVVTDETNEPEVLFMGLQHAREAIGGSSMIFLMQYLCQAYATDTRVRDLVNNREVFIVPCFNPDGWEYNRTNGGAGSGWRKNRRDNPGSSFGVDLNRNWGVDWSNCGAPIVGDPTSCGTNDPFDDTYYGPSAFSEPETQAIRDFAYTHHLVAMIDQHAYGPYYSLPFGRPSLSSNTMSTADDQFYTYTASAMGNYNGMRAGNSPQALGYEVAGGVKDWMLKGNIGTGTKGKVYGLTGEGGAGGGTGGTYGSFWAPASEIIDLCKGMTYQNLQFLYTAGSYVDLQDDGDINLLTRMGTLPFHMTRVGLENRPVTISLVPMENISTVGSPVTVSTLVNYYDTYTGGIAYTLPAAITSGQRVRFAWKIETGGYTYYDTVTKFYNATQLLYDDMEGSFSTNWTSNSVNANTGVTEENWSFSTLDKFAGNRSMTESASGNYYSRTTRTVTYNNTFDLNDATAAYLSFWVKHRAENFRDKLRIQVSTDGFSWTSIAGSTTVQEPGTTDGSTINGIPSLTGIKPNWTRELFDLRNYLGVPALRLRLQFTSNATASFDFSEDDGFYIDNLKVIKSTAPLVTLPVHFISFTGQLQADGTVRLDWSAITDEMHDHFEVEKSTNGIEFTSLGNGPSAAPYWKIDPAPLPGNNFYRIKQFDSDGSISYSQTIVVRYEPSIITSVFPNPVTSTINVRINTITSGQYTVSIADATGRILYEEKVATGESGKTVSFNVAHHTSQVYIITVRNRKNEIVARQKVAKLS
jgi:carboxypeptidase T